VGQFDARTSEGLFDYGIEGFAEQKRRWYMGRYAYVFGSVVPTAHVRCAGSLGFWRVPPAVVEEVGIAS
jgi:hypothetical protein